MRKITLLAGGTAIVALVLAGCGSTPGTDEQAAPGFDSVSVLAYDVSAKSAAKQSTHMAFTIEAAGQSFKGDGDLRLGAAPAMRLLMTMPQQGELTILLVDNAVYVKFPTELGPGKQWAKLDATSGDLGAVVRQLTKNGDPAQLLSQLEAASQITAKQQEDLNGRPTTHYSMTVDLQKLAAGQPDQDLKQLMEQASQAGIDKFPIELWLDQENLPARMTMATPFKNPANQQNDQLKLTVDYSDWGKPVDISAPPADQVTELPR